METRRVEFARALLNRRKTSLKPKYRTATWIDHKRVHSFGLNRSHTRQFRRIGSDKQVRPNPDSFSSPNIHALFAANASGTECFLHGQLVDMPRNQEQTWKDTKVNADEFVRALREKIVPFMRRTGSTVLFADGCGSGHSKKVREYLESVGIELYPSASKNFGDVPDGYPPYSHDCSILDASMFGTFQHDISQKLVEELGHEQNKHKCPRWLTRNIEVTWKEEKYTDLAQSHISGYSTRLVKILDVSGTPTYK